MLRSILFQRRLWRLGAPILLALALLLGLFAFTSLAANTIGWTPASTGLPVSGIIRDAAFGDVDNDGKPDMIVAGTTGVVVYKGDGTGIWSSVGMTNGLPSSGQYGHVIVADFNRDGKLDIAASQSSGGGVQAWSGNGAGSWTPWTGLPGGNSYEGLAFADVNKDGQLDLIAAGSAAASAGIHVYLNAPGTTFSETTPITTTGQYVDIAAGYVDGDGNIDVAAATSGAGLKFWRGSGSAWSYASSGLTTTNNFRGVALGDVDLDGLPELVAARSNISGTTGGGLFVYDYNTSTSSWSLAPNQLPITNSYFKLTLDDLNNDGWLDLVAGGSSTFSSPGIYAWLGSLNGFVATTSPTTTGSWERASVGDFNRDGLLDIGAGAFNSGGAQAWRSTGVRDPIGAWTVIASPQITDSPRALWAGDLNRDGDTDVIFNRAGGNGLNMYLGDGGNAWTYCPNFNTGGGAYTGTYESVVAVPSDRNYQQPQILAGRADGGGIQHFGNATNNCSYFFTYQVTTTGSYRGLSAADMDNNGYTDLVAAPFHLSNIGLRVWENGPNGWYLKATPVPTGTFYDTALADFNHDGDLDIAAADGSGGGVTVFQTGRWFRRPVTTTGEYYAIAAGDLNNDGHPDIVAAKNGTASEQGIYVWYGDGTGINWSPQPSPDTTGQYFDLDLGDVNHDGWLDILAARDGLGVMVWLGDGAGNWTPSSTNLPVSGAFFASRFSHVDHDGNLDIVSTGLNQGVKIWTAAEAAPPTINNFQPAASVWISTTQNPGVTANVIDTGSGISTTSGLYRYSTNGGSSWSSYAPAAISGSSGATSTQSISVASVPFGVDSATQNLVQFRASDMVGNVGSAQSVIKIDTVAPTAPTVISSTDHTINVWSNDNTISIGWSGATDATSGVFGYSVLFDQVSNTLPPTVINAGGTAFTSAALAGGTTGRAPGRTRDVAGNWSSTAIHLGPFKIDTTPPANPTSISSTDHTASVWSNDPTISMIWSGASDPGGSGVAGYSYVFDTASGTTPDNVQDTAGTSTASAALTSGNNKYFHIRTHDNAGNWSAAVQRGPYYIDVTAPSSSVTSPSSSSSTSFTVSWSGSDAHSGIASYDIQSRDKTTNGSWTTWKSATTSTSSTFYATSGHIYEFRSRARDNVGNLEAYPGSPDLTTEVRTIDVFVRNPGIEVNQAVQDLNNSVTLIANKRTFVRCYVQSDAGTINGVNARLRVYRGATLMGTLTPSNSGAQINIRTSPDRAQLDDAYYFDVPTGWLNSGSVRFECEVNLPKTYAENDYTNNLRSAGPFTFVKSPPMSIAMIDVDYWWGGAVRHVRDVDRTRLAAWLRTAYPINSLSVYYGYLDPPYDSLPSADTVNGDLAWNKAKKVFGAGEGDYWRYYGQAYDIGGFMRGLSWGSGSRVASGPTGTWSPPGWDPDGNWGDWYGGHENGHSYGRAHVAGAPYAGSGKCGDEAGPDGSYPYAQGRMSPQTTMWTNSTLYGFDWSVSPRFIVPPNWYDMMTYCPGQWISDYTYEAIYSLMMAETPVLKPTVSAEHLVVLGSIVSATNQVTLTAMYRLPNSNDLFNRDVSGTLHIKLLDAGHSVLADYNFSPRGAVEPDSPAQGITEMVPWISGTKYVVIANAAQQSIYTRTVSTNTPTVTVQAPAGGITLTGSSVIVSWAGGDADPGDVLTYSLDYSKDNGATWQPLSAQIPSTTVTIDVDKLAGSTNGKFRVWVSDGVNTATDETDGSFVVPSKAPEILETLPVSGTTYVVSQTISFEATAQDVEDGMLTGSALQWSSDLDGALGTGELLQLDTLSLGTHTITLEATDSNNNVATKTFTVVITAQPETPPSFDVFLPLITKN